MTPTGADRHGFAFDERFRLPLALIGVRAETAYLLITPHGLRVRFGPWEVVTHLGNVADVQITGPYSALKAIGTRMSLDRGLTFGTNTEQGVCVRFHRSVHGIEPIGLVRHPALTITVADPVTVAGLLRRAAPPDRAEGRQG